ncbi:unnamed protein product, partial [Ectocarpus sp. 12 AP-2014]
EPSLFEGLEPAAAQASQDDGLPPPAYQPQPEAPAAEQGFASARPAGTPTAEAIARLERVTGRAPGSMTNHVPGEARYRAPMAAPAPAPQPQEAADHADRPRFGINTLINRMSGAGETHAQPARQQPSLSQPAAPQDMQEDHERIEIPAFLRRQAN